MLFGAADITIGDTLADPVNPMPLPFVKISEPTLEMTFSVNDSPFAGKEGKFVTSRQLRKRLYDELLRDVSLRVRDGETTDCFKVSGRGEMHLGILIETIRQGGVRACGLCAQVIYHYIDGKKCEPIERLFIDVPDVYVGADDGKAGREKGRNAGYAVGRRQNEAGISDPHPVSVRLSEPFPHRYPR